MEYLDLYDENRNLTGEKIIRRVEKPKDGTYIIIVIVFIENSEGKFLIQFTSKEKGSIWATTGGLVKSGSTSNKTIVEEIKEELGLDVNIDELKLMWTEKKEHVFQDVYYLKKDININDIKLQKEEVELVKWLSVSEIKKLIDSDNFRKGNINAFEYVLKHK